MKLKREKRTFKSLMMSGMNIFLVKPKEKRSKRTKVVH